ncbi:DUF4310 family protein [Enterococcus faecium]|nr:DUF4310 family protein [Enterococcus faecium]NTK67529.1 DUF4310 family protein [Enterococcus faecium]NTQ62922.1 DUF4310 family protein [Enterococcus faecium]
METTEEQAKVLEVKRQKSFWFADWSFPLIVGIMSAAVFAGTHMYVMYGVGAFNEVSIVAMLKAGLDGGSYGAAAAFGASFLFARILEGSLVGILNLGGSILTGIGIGVPAILLSMKIAAPIDNFALSLLTGLVLGLIVGGIIVLIRKFTINQSNSIFGADVMMGAGNSSGRFLGPLIILSACAASIPIGIGATLGALGFYAWKKPIAGGAILGAMILGAIFPAVNIVVGAMTGSVIAMLSGVTDHVAHGGPIVAVLGAVDHVAMFFVAVIAGIAVTVLMLRILKPTLQHTAVAAANGVTVADLSETETSDVYTKTETFDSITEIMSDEAIVLGETATTKDGVIEDLVQRLEKTAAITDKNGFKEVIYDREKESTTGIAIPHGKSAYVLKPTVAFARSQDGVEWHSLDGKLAHMIFMIAVPENSQGDMHLKILQRLSRKLMDDDFRQALMDAPDKAAVHQLLSEM